MYSGVTGMQHQCDRREVEMARECVYGMDKFFISSLFV